MSSAKGRHGSVLGGEGLVHAFLEPEGSQEPAPGQAEDASAQAFGLLLCVPLWW